MKNIANCFRSLVSIAAAILRSCPRIARQASAYPELPRKSFVRRYLENLYFRFRDGGVCIEYMGLGLDVRGRGLDVITSQHWMNWQRRFMPQESMQTELLLQDKYLFDLYLRSFGVDTIPCWGSAFHGSFYVRGAKVGRNDFEREVERHSEGVFMKECRGMCGRGVRRLDFATSSVAESLNVNLVDADRMDYIFQDAVKNDSRIAVLNSSTLNTLRIATCRGRNGGVELWDPGVLRLGRRAASVDNFAAGGIAVAVNSDGRLNKFGITHDKDYNYFKVNEHPDSKMAFEGYEVPWYAEAVELVKRAHGLFPYLRLIGWDVALTQSGPKLLEGNHDCDVALLQIARNVGQLGRAKEILNLG